MKRLSVYDIFDEESYTHFVLVTGEAPRFGEKNVKKDEVTRQHAAEILRMTRTADEDGDKPGTITRRELCKQS